MVQPKPCAGGRGDVGYGAKIKNCICSRSSSCESSASTMAEYAPWSDAQAAQIWASDGPIYPAHNDPQFARTDLRLCFRSRMASNPE
jgi:hypothetical protein